MLIKNQIYDATICDYTSEGQGIAKIEGCAVFIPNALVGETCRVRIEKAQKTWATGKIVELLENARFEAIESNKEKSIDSAKARVEEKQSESHFSHTPRKEIPSKVFLRVPDVQCILYQKTRNLVDIFEGTVPVIFYDSSREIYQPYEHGVDATDFVLKELISILGKDNVVPKFVNRNNPQ